jgi:beta-glucosidase-like glycosyl hydrolase
MTSYNLLNGVWNHYNYELVTVILRGEWGYENNVMTDMVACSLRKPGISRPKTHAYRVRAQVDVFMPGNHEPKDREYHSDGTLLETLGRPDGITRGEIQRSAKKRAEIPNDFIGRITVVRHSFAFFLFPAIYTPSQFIAPFFACGFKSEAF